MKSNLTILIFVGLLTNIYLFGQSHGILTNYNFETSENITVSNNGIWEIGIPSKTDLNSVFQGNRVMITDSVNPLPRDTTSHFFIVIDSVDIQKGSATILEFWHNYALDETEDLAFIDFSYDGGISWYKGDNSQDNYEIFYSRYFRSTKTEYSYPNTIISGNSGEWVRERYIWNWFYCCASIKSAYSDYFPDSIIVRFNIKSGNPSERKDGWMIDSLSVSYDICSSIQENSTNYFNIYPNPFDTYISIELDNSLISTYEIYNSLGQLIKHDSNINLSKYSFDSKELKKGLYFMKIYDNQNNNYVKPLIKN